MQKYFAKIKGFGFDVRFTPVILLLLCLLSYAIFIPVTGFFIDDWYFMWFKHFFGALQFPAYYAWDRPFQGFFYPVASFLLLGSESPLVWGLFAVVLRWLSSLALWKMLRTLWQGADQQNILVAMLAAVFPGFTQHWFVVQYSYYYACLGLFFLSVTWMLKAVRQTNRFWLFYSLSLLSGFYAMTSEFFFGLELIRPVILLIEFSRSAVPLGKRLGRTFKYWSGFLAYFIGFGVWRFFFFVSQNHSVAIVNLAGKNAITGLLGLLRSFYQSILNGVVNSWAYPLNLSTYPTKGLSAILILGIMGAVLICLVIWLFAAIKKREVSGRADISRWRSEALWLSLSALIVAGIPFLAAGLTVEYLGFNDRFLLAYILGVCLLIVLLLASFSYRSKLGMVVVALLVAVSTGYQISNAIFFKDLWTRQKDLYWQMNWRIPGLQPGTTIFTSKFPTNNDYYSGIALGAQLNWTYSDRVVNRQVEYQFIILDSGQEDLISSLKQDTPIDINFRTFVFKGNTTQSIFVIQPDPGCLRVVDPTLTPPQVVLGNLIDNPSRKEIVAGAGLSDLSLILPAGGSPNHPPTQILGAEIPHTWCYYFQKADLARQFGDYAQVIALLDEAKAKGFAPGVGSEWYPFIDAYARSGSWGQAASITTELTANLTTPLQQGLCHLWQALAKDYPKPGQQSISAEMLTSALHCIP